MAARIRTLTACRLLTIGYSFYIHKRSDRRPPPPVPYLRLRGYWLKQAGFAVGQRVRVDVVNGRITIIPSQEA
ncbi:SymE family type I addiction module toxin [Dyella sp. S184]|jgi:toxic protein SymE|uniref:SymE family type I addiction module toxin n=1 Tax=Dyella sp. S184 TaxID=1641862 RepID=UPI00131C20DC|nr:SymE family type I addiction module toxin [Dyella sp. S184]